MASAAHKLQTGFAFLSCAVFATVLAGCDSGASQGTNTVGPRRYLMDYAEAGHPHLKKITGGWHVYPPADMNVIPHDVFVTWIGTWPDLSAGTETWAWEGELVGRGAEGWDAVCRKLDALPEGTRVLLYPRDYIDGRYCKGYVSGPAWGRPWQRTRFLEIVSRRKLTAIYSIRDHNGRVHPLWREDYTRWAKGLPPKTRRGPK